VEDDIVSIGNGNGLARKRRQQLQRVVCLHCPGRLARQLQSIDCHLLSLSLQQRKPTRCVHTRAVVCFNQAIDVCRKKGVSAAAAGIIKPSAAKQQRGKTGTILTNTAPQAAHEHGDAVHVVMHETSWRSHSIHVIICSSQS
jgi:hypothetical protein